MKPEEMTAVQERRFRKSVDYFRKNREIYVRRIKKILEEYKNALAAEKADEESDVLQLQEAFSLKSLIPDKVYNMSTTSTPFSFPPTPALSEAQMFSPWPMVGMETPMSDPNFSFPLPTTPLSLTGTTPECSTPAAAATFGYSNFGGLNAFYPNVAPAYCQCADCLGKSALSLDLMNNSPYAGLYPSEDSVSTMQKSVVSSGGSQSKDEAGSRGLSSGSQYPSADSNELESESQFELAYFCSTGSNNESGGQGNKESFTLSPPSSDKKNSDKVSDGAIDNKVVQKKGGPYQVDSRASFNGLSHDNIDYYASMNSFPNNHPTVNSTASLFPNYSNRAVIGAGDGAGALSFRNSGTEQQQQSQQTGVNTHSSAIQQSHAQESTAGHQAPIMMFNNTSSYAMPPYMSWSQGEHPLMMPTVFANPGPNSALDASFPAGMQPIQAPPPSGTQALFATGAASKERPPGAHDEHNPDYSNCFPSSNSAVVANNSTTHESY